MIEICKSYGAKTLRLFVEDGAVLDEEAQRLRAVVSGDFNHFMPPVFVIVGEAR